MAKGKNVTAQEIEATLSTLYQICQDLAALDARIACGRSDALPKSDEYAHGLVVAARDCNQFSLRMMNRSNINQMLADRKQMEAEIASLEANNK